jgi:hypothetical protein
VSVASPPPPPPLDPAWGWHRLWQIPAICARMDPGTGLGGPLDSLGFCLSSQNYLPRHAFVLAFVTLINTCGCPPALILINTNLLRQEDLLSTSVNEFCPPMNFHSVVVVVAFVPTWSDLSWCPTIWWQRNQGRRQGGWKVQISKRGVNSLN